MIKLRHLAYCTAAAFAFTGAANTVSLKPDDNWKVIRFNVNQIDCQIASKMICYAALF